MTAQTVIEWIVDPNTCFLFGAGCSHCMGKPLMSRLTDFVKVGLSDRTREILESLCGTYHRPATIEDLINHLLQIGKLANSQTQEKYGGWSRGEIDKEIENIQHQIVQAIDTKWENSETHSKFLKRLSGHSDAGILDIFCLNYDTLIEATLEEFQFAYTDGFRGSENAYFDSRLYEESAQLFSHHKLSESFFRLYKPHGSINWIRDEDGTVRRKPAREINGKRAVVYPAEQKYVQTQYGVYEKLLILFRDRLRVQKENNKLVVLGYSFSDEHINVAIEDSLRENPYLHVYAFVGLDKDQDTQVQHFQEFAERSDNNRFNALIGDHTFVGPGLSQEEFEKIKNLNLWQFEALTDLIVKGR